MLEDKRILLTGPREVSGSRWPLNWRRTTKCGGYRASPILVRERGLRKAVSSLARST